MTNSPLSMQKQPLLLLSLSFSFAKVNFQCINYKQLHTCKLQRLYKYKTYNLGHLHHLFNTFCFSISLTSSITLCFCSNQLLMRFLLAGWRVHGGLGEGKAVDISRYCFCFSSAKQRTESLHTLRAEDGGTGLKSSSFEYSVMRWNMYSYTPSILKISIKSCPFLPIAWACLWNWLN